MEDETIRLLIDACEAGERYDQSILGRAASGEVSLTDSGVAYAAGLDLDEMYTDWVRKIKLALESVRGIDPEDSEAGVFEIDPVELDKTIASLKAGCPDVDEPGNPNRRYGLPSHLCGLPVIVDPETPDETPAEAKKRKGREQRKDGPDLKLGIWLKGKWRK